MLKKNAAKIVCAIIIVFLFTTILLTSVSATTLITSNEGSMAGSIYFSTPDIAAQTFTVRSSDYDVTSVEVLVGCLGDIGTMYVEICNTDSDGYPSGDAISTGTLTSLPGMNPNWVRVSMSPYTLSAGQKYAIVCSAPYADRKQLPNGWPWSVGVWAFSSTSYDGGAGFSNNGNGWAIISADLMFRVYGDAQSTSTPPPTPAPTPSPSPEPEAPTYTVWKSGSNYYAKDAYGDPVPGYGSGNDSASVIINACVGAIRTGGEIAIREGEFICTGTIYVTGKAILFRGTGKGEIGQAGTSLTFNSSFNGFDINVNPGNVYTTSVTIEDMLIHGAPSNGTAIKSKGRYLTVRHVDIEQFDVGISLEMANGYSAGDSLIDDCVIRHCEYQGVLIGSNDNRMSNVIVHHCWQGLELSGFSGGLNAYNVHLWGNRANGLLITNSSKDHFYNLQCDEDGNYNVVISPWANQNGYVRDIKFMNCFFWSDKKEVVNPTYSGALYFGGDRPIDNVSIIGGKIGIPCFKADTKMKKVGNNANGTFIRMVDLNDATNDPIYPFTTGSSTSDIYLCQGITP
jgi:hypothetical protein